MLYISKGEGMADASKIRMQQIVSECFVKSAHIILTSRIYHSSRTLSMKGPKCWVRAVAPKDLDLLGSQVCSA